MRKKDYELIAGAINQLQVRYKQQYKDILKTNDNSTQWLVRGKVLGVGDTAYYVATALELVDPKFKRDKFLELCGTEHL